MLFSISLIDNGNRLMEQFFRFGIMSFQLFESAEIIKNTRDRGISSSQSFFFGKKYLQEKIFSAFVIALNPPFQRSKMKPAFFGAFIVLAKFFVSEIDSHLEIFFRENISPAFLKEISEPMIEVAGII